jgi:hypothetical protein
VSWSQSIDIHINGFMHQKSPPDECQDASHVPCIVLKAEFLAVIQAVHSLTAHNCRCSHFQQKLPGAEWMDPTLCQESHTFNVSPVSP